MIQAADALKLKCKFVEKVLKFLNDRKYVVDICPCVAYSYYADYVLSGLLYDAECLEAEDECTLNTTANTYTAVEECEDAIASCDGQLDISLSSLTTSCVHTADTANSINNSALPIITTTSDSIYIGGNIDIRVTSDCHTQSTSILGRTTINGGCTSAGCSDSAKGKYTFGIQTTSTFNLSDEAYISILRVYETDSTGNLIDTPINLDLNPSTSPYYTADVTDCPGCTTILDTEIQIGSTDFTTAFATLMDNVSLARYGSTGKHSMSAVNLSANSIRIDCNPKHNPASNWFGIRPSNAYVLYEDDTTGGSYAKTGTNTATVLPLKFYNASTNFSTPCGTFTPVVGNQSTSFLVDGLNTSFNKIALTSNFGTKPILVTSNSTYNCTSYLLTATYDSTNVASVA